MLVPKPIGHAYSSGEALPDPLPETPFPLLQSWFAEAHSGEVRASDRADAKTLPTGLPAGAIAPNPNAMVLATVDAAGQPSARVVLCKHIEPDPGYLVFYSNYHSRKGRAISENPRVAATFHWDALERQARVEGIAVVSPDAESDAYFRSRALASRLGAWASDQSQPLDARATLVDRLAQVAERFGVPAEAVNDDARASDFDIPRPPNWGGLRIYTTRVELWCGGPGRVHDRAAWTREIDPGEPRPDRPPTRDPRPLTAWSSTRLFP